MSSKMNDAYLPKKHISLLAHDILTHLMAVGVGRENAQKIDVLAARYSVIRREIEFVTEELRGAGIPLCSSVSNPFGLFLARDFAEMKSWILQINHRFAAMAAHRATAIAGLKAQAEREGIQMEMEIA